MSVEPKPGQLTFAAPRRAKPPRHLADLSSTERRDAVAEFGEKPFRADQLSRHYFTRLADDPAAMTDLPAALRDRLIAEFLPPLLTSVRQLTCDDGTTQKSLWKAFDGTLIESVLMRYPDRVTMCVSSQAGCGMNCPFCATGQAGLTRNLSTAEIVEQVVAGARALDRGEIAGGPGRVSNIVFMGMGEPLANYNGRARCGTPHHRPRATWPGDFAALGDGVDRRVGAGHRKARRRGHAGAVGALAACSR